MLLEVQALTKVYNENRGLLPVSLEVEKGELIALIGHNGAGKSTFLKMLASWLLPDSGQVLVDGINLKNRLAVVRKIGFVPETPSLFDSFSVEYNLKIYARLFQVPFSRIEDILKEFDLLSFRKNKVQVLSKGLRQRVSIGRALLADPPVLLFDEPTSGIDFEMTQEIHRLLKDFHVSGKTILFSSHRPEEIRSLATRIIVLHKGHVAFDGPPQKYFQVRDPRKAVSVMIRNIITLVLNDLAIAFKNKTIYLIIFIPFFVFLSLKLIDSPGADFKEINIGLVQEEAYAPVILQAIKAADGVFRVSSVSDEEEGRRLLKEKKIDGLLLRSEKEQNTLVLVVLKKDSLLTLSIVESFSALQKAVEGNRINWISDIKPLHEGGIQKQTLPTWILMLVLLVSFIIIPAQVAEEKEKKLLLALLQTPMREVDWLLAKLISGMILILMAVFFLHLLGRFDIGDGFSYAAFIVAGSFCFSSYGIFLGFLCRNQASARTLGVVFYLPHLLPSALSDFSQKLNAVAPFLPSYQFYEAVRSILLEEGRLSNLSLEWMYLLAVGLLTSSFAYMLMKKRWLM